MQIGRAEYSFPNWFSNGAKSLIRRILDPNPDTVSAISFYCTFVILLVCLLSFADTESRCTSIQSVLVFTGFLGFAFY